MSEARRIIVIKRPVMAAGHHGGAWKIAFADFMTAMMAFFLVMWLVSTSSPKQLAGIAEHFKMPLKIALAGGPAASNNASVIPGGGTDPSRTTGDVTALESESSNEIADVKRLEELKERVDAMIEANPVLKQFRPQLLIDITPEGLRIQIVDSNNRPMFDRSSAIVLSYMRTILREIGPVLNAQPSKITLSGHTDAAQYAERDKSYSNWELSSDRANASRRELVAGGLMDDKVLRVMGVASGIHLNKEDPYAATNRRISIVVLNRRTQAQIEGESAEPVKPGNKSLPAPPGSADKPASKPSSEPAGAKTQ